MFEHYNIFCKKGWKVLFNECFKKVVYFWHCVTAICDSFSLLCKNSHKRPTQTCLLDLQQIELRWGALIIGLHYFVKCCNCCCCNCCSCSCCCCSSSSCCCCCCQCYFLHPKTDWLFSHLNQWFSTLGSWRPTKFNNTQFGDPFITIIVLRPCVWQKFSTFDNSR